MVTIKEILSKDWDLARYYGEKFGGRFFEPESLGEAVYEDGNGDLHEIPLDLYDLLDYLKKGIRAKRDIMKDFPIVQLRS